MEILLALFVFLIGTFVGSFLNVVILRHNTGGTLLGRSACPACGKTLRWFELVPIASFVIQGGRCRRCTSPISIQYPLVELVSGLLFLAVFLQSWSFVEIVIGLLAIVLTVVIFVYDLRHMIIPDTFAWLLVAVGVVLLFVGAEGWVVPELWSLLAGPALALPFASIWFLSRGTWMGLGDAKLTLGLGTVLGLQAGFVMLLYAFWIGALVSVPIVVMQRAQLSSGGNRLTMKSEVPFGPFLILAFWFVYLLPSIAQAPLTYLQL